MKSSWSLTDTLNTDFDRGSLFDDLPEASNKMQQFTESKSSDKGAINKSLELSSVPSDQREQLEQMGSYTPSSEENKTAPNPLDFVAPEKAAPPQTPQEDDWTLGKYFSVAREGLQKLDSIEKQNNFGSATQRGVNKARFEAYKSQLMEELSDRIENKFGILRAEVGGLFLGLSKDGSGFRSREDIDQIADIRKNGVAILDDTGNPRHFNAQSWDQAMELQKIRRSREIEIGLKKSGAVGGGVEEISKWQGVMKNTLDAEGNVMPDRMGEYEKAASEIDRLTGAPTGVSKFASRYNSKQDRISKMTAAMDSGIPYKGLAVEQIPSEILKLNQETVELAVENAPYFGANDREAAAKWVTDPATKGLPFRSDYEGKKIPYFVTSEPGVYNIWSPKEKTWMVVDKRKPETATAAEPTDNSQFSEAGKTGQKIRKAGGGLVRAVKGASTAVGEKISNIPAGAANAGASIVEVGAGVFNIPLKIPRAPSISESLEKMGLKKYEDGTWGPLPSSK
jgi:hypothetical protein